MENNSVKIRVQAPLIDDLCCIVCELDWIEVQDSSAKSNFHWQIMKCRYFIYMAPEIIAAPILETTNSIFVIMKKEYYMSGVCDTLMKKMNLKFGGVRSLTTHMYKSCIAYTLQCKMAPHWNKIGPHFLAGKNFYSSIHALSAMDFEIFVDDKHVHFELTPKIVNFRYMRPENLFLSSKQMAEFLADPDGFIDLSNRPSTAVHVLPSMKRGKVLSISKKIPPDCPFKDYSQLRRHWKNMYGFFLPKEEDGVVYYKIKFPVAGSHPFTYPHFCITAHPLTMRKGNDEENAVKSFLGAVCSAVPSICGEKLKFSRCNCGSNDTPITTRSARTSLPSATTTNTGEKENNLQSASAKIEFSANYLKTVAGNSKNQIGASNTRRNMSTPQPMAQNRKISEYFKIQKPHTNAKAQAESNSGVAAQISPLQALQLRKAAKDEVDVIDCARNNQLGRLTVKQLSDWLEKNSIPHNRSAKKLDLIEKVLAHLRNTQPIQKYRA